MVTADVQQSPQDGWLQSDNTVLISALAAITVATSSVLLWCCQRPTPLQDTIHSPAASTVPTTLTSLRFSDFSGSISDDMRVEVIAEEGPRGVTQQRSERSKQGPRSKERRRRGKDPFKEFSKGGKKYKELLRQLNRSSTASNGVSTTATSERDCPRREQNTLETHGSPRVQTPDSSGPDGLSSNQHSTVHGSPAPSSNKSLDETANPLSADKSVPEAKAIEEPEDQRLSSQPMTMTLSDTTAVLGAPSTSSLDPSSKAFPGHLPVCPLESSILIEPSCSTSNSSSRGSQGGSHSRGASSWDWDGQSSFCHAPPPRFAGALVMNPQRESSFPICSSVTFSPPNTPSSLSGILNSPSIGPSMPCDAASPVAASLGSPELPPIPSLPIAPLPVSVSAQTEIASLRGALEAARLREGKSRAEAERRAKDYDALSWHWTEERTRWHHREAELYAQIQHLTLALQMYTGSRPFSTATVPIFPAFVPSPLPCTVPSTLTHRFCNPAVDSAAARGRCRKRVQDNREGNADSNSDASSFNDKVAGAILKRPENLRAGARRNSTPPNEVGPLRFPSLSDLGNVWPARESNAETPRRGFRYTVSMGIFEDGKETEGTVEMEDDKTSEEKILKGTLSGTDNTKDQISHDEELG